MCIHCSPDVVILPNQYYSYDLSRDEGFIDVPLTEDTGWDQLIIKFYDDQNSVQKRIRFPYQWKRSTNIYEDDIYIGYTIGTHGVRVEWSSERWIRIEVACIFVESLMDAFAKTQEQLNGFRKKLAILEELVDRPGNAGCMYGWDQCAAVLSGNDLPSH